MKIALVTGGGSGIGRAASGELAKDGFRVVLAGRRLDALNAAAAEIDGAIAVQADVTDPSSVTALFDQIEKRFGRLDLLFNNAGTGTLPTAIEDLDPATWSEVLNVNLTGAFLCTQHAIRMMKAQNPRGGRIINNGSISAHSPRPDAVAYTVSKHGMTGLTRATSLEGRRHGIACGQIDIGNASTQMTNAMQQGVLQADGSTAAEPTIPVAIVAKAVAQMASLPLEANVQSMIVMATNMPFIGRG